MVIGAGGGSYQDALREAIFKPFEKTTGIKVIEATGPTLAKLRAMITSGNPEFLLPQVVVFPLVIAPGTAANHVHAILEKLGLASRAQVAAWAVAHSLAPDLAPR